MMKTVGLVVLGAVVGALAAGFISQSVAQQAVPDFQGVQFSNRSWERYVMSVGITTSGLAKTATTQQHEIQQLNLPQYYGRLVGVTGHGDTDVLWFADEHGYIRTAIVPDVAQQIYRIEPMPYQPLEIRHKP